MSEGTYRRRVLMLFKLAVSLGFIWFVLQSIDLTIVKGYLKEADLREFLFATVTLVIGGFCGALSWRVVLIAKGYQLSFLKIAAMHWCGMFFNSFLPSNIGGDVYKGYLLVNTGGGLSKASVTILLDRIINFATLVLIGALSFCLLHGWTWMALTTAVVFVLGVILLRTLALRKALRGDSRLAGFLMSMVVFFRDGRNCVLVFGAALLSQSLKIGCHIFLIRAMGLNLDASCVWYIIPLFGVISALPISLGGIGIREYVGIAIAAPLNIAQEELVALSLVSHLLFVCVNCLGFIPFVIMRNIHGGSRAP